MVVNRNPTSDYSSESLALHRQNLNHTLRREQSVGSMKQSLPKGIKRLLQKGKSAECPGTIRSLSVSPIYNAGARGETSASLSNDERQTSTNLSPSPPQSKSRTSLVRQKASVDIPF